MWHTVTELRRRKSELPSKFRRESGVDDEAANYTVESLSDALNDANLLRFVACRELLCNVRLEAVVQECFASIFFHLVADQRTTRLPQQGIMVDVINRQCDSEARLLFASK